MDKTGLYIQKLIIFFLVFILGIILSPLIKVYYLLPILFFTLAFLVSRITGQKPDFLFGLSESDEFINKKAGFWILFKWIIMLFGLVYELVAWTIFGVYLLFALILDFISLIKIIIYWIIHAILWFLKLFVPPIVFSFKMIIYYFFRWNWWIYKLSFRNLSKSLNRNFYYISLRGAVLMSFVILLFYGVGLLMGNPGIILLGAVFSVLPLVWSYGEISSLRLRNAEADSYSQVKIYFQSGFDAVRAVLGYFIIFLFLAFLEVLLNILGWIPNAGFSFMGLALNINTLASLILLFVFVVLIFAKLIMPPHVVYNKDFTSNFSNILVFIGVIGKRFLRYVFSGVSSAFFGIIILLIPALIVLLSVIITLNVKNSILDARIGMLSQRANVLEGLEKYKVSKEIDRMYYYKNFPQNVIDDFSGMKSMNSDIKNLKENIVLGEKEIASLNVEFTRSIDSLDNQISRTRNFSATDSTTMSILSQMEILKQSRLENFKKWKRDAELSIGKMKLELSDQKGLMIQLPIVFLFSLVWASFFLGLVLAFLVSYLGNVYFELYNFREDNNPTYFDQVISEIIHVDRNQPLLGFTLLAIIGLLVFNFNSIISFLTGIFN